MSTLLLPDLARATAAFHRKVADSVEAETRRVERLRVEKEPEEALQKRAARSAREALRHTLSHAPDVQVLWKNTLEIIKDGIEGDKLRKLLRDVRGVVESWLILAQQTRGLFRFVAATAATAAELDELTRVVAGIAEVQAAAEKVSAFTSRAKPTVDPALLEKGREEIDQGKMKSSEQMRGGPEGQKA